MKLMTGNAPTVTIKTLSMITHHKLFSYGIFFTTSTTTSSKCKSAYRMQSKQCNIYYDQQVYLPYCAGASMPLSIPKLLKLLNLLSLLVFACMASLVHIFKVYLPMAIGIPIVFYTCMSTFKAFLPCLLCSLWIPSGLVC